MEIAERLFQIIYETKKVSKDVLLGLHFIFQVRLTHALEIIETDGMVTQIICDPDPHNPQKNGQAQMADEACFYSVKGSSNANYLCLPASNFCTCPAYLYAVIGRGDTFICKHVLAVKIGMGLGKFRVARVSPVDYAKMLMAECA